RIHHEGHRTRIAVVGASLYPDRAWKLRDVRLPQRRRGGKLMNPQGWSTTPGIWIGAIGTLALFSLLYRENRVFRLFEHLFIVLAAGYLIKATWTEPLKPQWWDPMMGG